MEIEKSAKKEYLEEFGITSREVQAVMGKVKVRDVDYADLYFEHTVAESVSMEESLVKRASKSISQGVGVRATAGEKTGYAYSDEISVRQLEQAADTARYIARSPAGEGQVPAISVGRPSRDLYPVGQPATEVATKEKVSLLQKIDALARAYDPRIKNVMASFSTEYKMVMVANSQGELVGDLQPLSRLQITCIAEEKGERQMGSYGGGGRAGFGFFFKEGRWEHYTREAARQAILNLSAGDAPAGLQRLVVPAEQGPPAPRGARARSVRQHDRQLADDVAAAGEQRLLRVRPDLRHGSQCVVPARPIRGTRAHGAERASALRLRRRGARPDGRTQD